MKRTSYKPSAHIQLSIFDTQPQVSEIEKLIQKAELCGCYQFPFNGGYLRDAIVDESLTFSGFYENDKNWIAKEFQGKYHVYTKEEMISLWNVVLCQRKHFKAALLVANKKCKSFNEALRSFEK